MFTVVIAVDGELQSWEKETKGETEALIRSLSNEREGQRDILVFPCHKSNLKVSTQIELDS